MKILLAAVAFVALVLVLRGISGGGSGAAPLPDVPHSDEGVRELLGRGRKIEAIKLYRELHGVGLREAKEAVERAGRSAP